MKHKQLLQKIFFACAIITATITTDVFSQTQYNVTGNWKYVYSDGTKSGKLELAQAGDAISGTLSDWEGNYYVISGTIKDTAISFTAISSSKSYSFSGTVNNNKEMTCKFYTSWGENGDLKVTKD
ncbi:MAG: hypothetical protein WCI77_08715 [Candidatus Omnitrophota bacterium]